jgi:hypothetical protein
MNNYGAKDFLVSRFEALRARRNELAAIVRPLNAPAVAAGLSLDLGRLPADEPVPAAVLFRREFGRG